MQHKELCNVTLSGTYFKNSLGNKNHDFISHMCHNLGEFSNYDLFVKADDDLMYDPDQLIHTLSRINFDDTRALLGFLNYQENEQVVWPSGAIYAFSKQALLALCEDKRALRGLKGIYEDVHVGLALSRIRNDPQVRYFNLDNLVDVSHLQYKSSRMSGDGVPTELKVYAKGTKAFFVDDAEAWVQATLTEKLMDEKARSVQMKFQRDDDSDVTYTFSASFEELRSGKKTLPPLCNPPALAGIDDLTSLSHLNEPAVLYNLQERYAMHNIYTYSGIVLVALNPFARVPLYSQDTLEAYAGRMRGELEPHLFAISEDAYQGMVRDRRNQTIVVSGESGAGKTMSAKYIMRYFASAHDGDSQQAGAASPRSGDVTGAKAQISRVEEQILATNPVLESFGNAKTTRNDNSSRFGKFLEIRFNERHAIEAAFVRTYLLERSRLVYQPATERNYHVFYQLLAGADEQLRSDLHLGPWDSFHYTSQGGTGSVANVDDAAEFAQTSKALRVIGVSAEQQRSIHTLLAALLHIGNIDIAATTDRAPAAVPADDAACKYVVELLQIDGTLFTKWLTKRQIVTRSEKIVSAMTRPQALAVRDAVAKFIYAHLFDWIVKTINGALTGGNGDAPAASFIGVLDIYGFEHFEHNSFEQFCINYANEKLQQNFNRHVFKLEQDEYQREQLQNWTFVDFQDNQPCIDLIEGRLGILALLDEECRLQQGSDANFAEKLYKQFAPSPKPTPATPAAFFRKPRFGADSFTVRHYAHDVEYQADGFVEKNRDTVPDEIQNVLKASRGPLLPELLAPQQKSDQQQQSDQQQPAARLSVRAARKPTLGSVFKHSLVNLMETIAATDSHYIRCIKPNEAKEAWKFDAPMVLAQLRACGVLETIRISCAGYPSRLPIPDFILRYGVLLNDSARLPSPEEASVDAYRHLASRILERAFDTQDCCQVGLTKVFFRAGMLALIEKQRVERLNAAATAIQSLVRSYQQRTRFLRQRRAACVLQALARCALARRRVRILRDTAAATTIQAQVRTFLARMHYTRKCHAILFVQACVRGKQARARFYALRREQAAIHVQRCVRRFLARARYHRELRLVTRMQALVRQQLATRLIQKRKEEARSAAHFQKVTYQLEDKLMALTRQLDESQTRVAHLSEELRLAHAQSQKLRDEQAASVAAATAELTARVEQLQIAKDDADRQCADLTQQLADARSELEAIRGQASDDKAQQDIQRQKLEQQLQELERELQESREQLADARAQHQKQQLLIHQQQPPLLTPQAADHAASIKRAETTSRWHASAGLSATGYDMADSFTSPNMRSASAAMPKQQQQQQQQQTQQNLQQRRPHSVDRPRDMPSPPSSTASKRATVGGEEGRTLAKMLSSLGAFGSSQNNQQQHASFGNTTIVEEEDEDDAARYALQNEDEVREMLEHDDRLFSEVLNELIGDLQVPLPNLDAEYSPPDLLFPAHLIGLCVIKMFQYNLARRIDRLLMSTIARIQKKTAAFDSDYTSAFWLSNVFELLSIIKTSMTEHQSASKEYEESERAMNDGMQYLESLLSDIYFGWIKDMQKRFSKLIIPGVVESEALPGFTAGDSGFFNRLMGTGPRESTVKIENVLSFFNHIWRTMEFYYVDQAIMRQIMSELLCIIGVTAFNNIIMRRNFCSWKRGMQIQYNLTRIEEWCKTHSVSDATRNLDRLLQLVKLLQLQKSTEQDIDIMFEVCDLLNPAQIKKLLSIYAVSDYENPIIGPVMNEVTRRAAPTEKTDKMLLDTNDLSEQVLYLTARKVPAIETYIPPEYRMPRIRALVDSQTVIAYDEDEEDQMMMDDAAHMDQYYDEYGDTPPAAAVTVPASNY
ncbi:Myosin type-2 heavy chain 1 [Coemansia sp. RSA 1821]|nr:Myosin type-2 heavy chain 1 [Coemansia sp. RSA 1821]